MAHTTRTTEEAVAKAELEHHVDRTALVTQLRALASSVEHLAHAVEGAATDGEAIDPSVASHLEEARWSLKDIW